MVPVSVLREFPCEDSIRGTYLLNGGTCTLLGGIPTRYITGTKVYIFFQVCYWANLREGFPKRTTSGILNITWVGPLPRNSHHQDDITILGLGKGDSVQNMKDEKVVAAMGTKVLTKVCSYQMSLEHAGNEPDFRLFWG